LTEQLQPKRVVYKICPICKDNQKYGASIYTHLQIIIDGKYYQYIGEKTP